MKLKVLGILFSIFFLTVSIKAQVGMGDVMGKILNGIKPSAFTSGKAGKSDLISQLSGIKTTDYLKYASIAGSLAGVLKETSFLPSWASQKDGVLDQIQNAASIADVAGGVSGLLGNINPSALTSGFKKNKSSVTSALNILSMMK